MGPTSNREMAPGLKVGDRVKAKPTVVFGCRRAGDIFGPWASEREVHGTVKDVLGNGRSRKLQVIWDECSDISTVSPRVLQLDNSCAMLQEDKESVSSQSGEEVSLEEEEQAVERLDEEAVDDEIALLRPHDTNWAMTEGICVDYFQGTKSAFSLVWNFTSPVAQRTVLDYFSAMFPMSDTREWIRKTNVLLNDLKQRSLSEFEYFRFWGLILAISIGRENNRRSYWMEEIDCDTRRVFQPFAFGSRFGMGIRRFEFILRCLSFGDMDPMDRWSPIRPFLAAINERRQQVIDPSYILVEDELMSSWISRKQDRTIDGIPHLNYNDHPKAQRG